MTIEKSGDRFNSGIVIRDVPLDLAYPGKQFWVSNSTTVAHQLSGAVPGSDAGAYDGSFNKPFATIDYAVGRCTAGRGDVIFVKPNHAETLANATSLLLDVAGVAVVGLGTGSSRPTISMSATTSNIPVSAANVTVYNLLFVPVTASTLTTSVFTVSGTALATDFTVQKCEFRDVSTTVAFTALLTGNATAANLSGLYFADNTVIFLATTAARTAIKLLEACNRVKVLRNTITGPGIDNTAILLAGSTFNHLQFELSGNIGWHPATSSTNGLFVSGSGSAWTGHAHRNYFWHLDNSSGIWIVATTKLAFSQNYSPITAVADKSAVVAPAAV